MKNSYELRCRRYFPRRSYVIVRVDGRSFHTWTKGLVKPYDTDLMTCMDTAALALVEGVTGCKLGYVQSDEVSLLITDFDTTSTEAWLDGCQNKIESITASIATMGFNLAVRDFNYRCNPCEGRDEANWKLGYNKKPNATFDSRAFIIPDYVEVENYFLDRQMDAARNSVTMLANFYTSHKKLLGQSVAQRHEFIFAAGDNWAKHPTRFKRGAVLYKAHEGWIVDPSTPDFKRDRDFLRNLIPRHWQGEENG